MKRRIAAVLACAALLSGCSAPVPELPEETTVPVVTIQGTGDADSVTCLGSYTGTGSETAVVARMADAELTNEQLRHWYRAEIAQYRQSGREDGPDFALPLDVQTCEIDGDAISWQQYFLKQALNRWHTAQALIRHSWEVPLPLEDAYKGNPEMLENYMGQMPVKKLLYGYDPFYRPNTLHQQFLDGLEGEMAYDLNYGYMYFTTLAYALEEAEVTGGGEPLVTFRQILLLPEDGDNPVIRGAQLLSEWAKGRNAGESTFAQLASTYSRDDASAKSGGVYRNVGRDQLPQEIAQWCFEENRKPGDAALIPTEEGVRILYFSGTTNTGTRQAARKAKEEARLDLLESIRQMYPIQVDYRQVVLTEYEEGLSVSDLLYPDIAHERFPEVPLYLQQNYLGTMYGDHKLTTNGCGITSMAMLASYMSDQELTPPQLSARYGRYSRPTGTSGSLFEEVPPQLGFYLIKKTYDWKEAKAYMEQGYSAVVCQHKGYWTRGGHYLVLEKMTEEGLVQVRDSNMANYSRLPLHKEDAFPWDTLRFHSSGYWIYEKKVTAHPACTRCGDPETVEYQTVTDYLCEKCEEAMLRREVYLQ